jgi:DNA polymerase-3 subunit delta'
MRVVLLHPAEALNQASANALLKMLEEPPPGVLFLMVTHQPQRLLPTIRSRCNAIAMPVPDRPVAEAWLVEQGISQASQRLAYAGGSPLLVLQQDADGDRRLQDLQAMLMLGAQMDPFVTAGVCAREGMEWMVNALQKWVHDLVCTKLTRQFRYHLAWAEPLQGLAKRVDLPSLLDFQRTLDEARRHALHPLNTELQLESLLIQYTQIFTKRS